MFSMLAALPLWMISFAINTTGRKSFERIRTEATCESTDGSWRVVGDAASRSGRAGVDRERIYWPASACIDGGKGTRV